MARLRTTPDDFWLRVDKNGPTQKHMPTPCWLWTGCLGTTGYGMVSFARESWSAHRLAWTLTNGQIPKGLCVLHHCDERQCVNPEHLYVGTKKNNSDDMFSRGRGNRAFGDRNGSRKHRDRRPRGEENGLSTLTEDQVREIRRRYSLGGVTMSQLGAEYGLWKGSICRIIRRKTWDHVA